jgi:hypothetical protein
MLLYCPGMSDAFGSGGDKQSRKPRYYGMNTTRRASPAGVHALWISARHGPSRDPQAGGLRRRQYGTDRRHESGTRHADKPAAHDFDRRRAQHVGAKRNLPARHRADLHEASTASQPTATSVLVS